MMFDLKLPGLIQKYRIDLIIILLMVGERNTWATSRKEPLYFLISFSLIS